MLILSRHKDETIVITLGGVRVTMTVVETRNDRCRVGFDAPTEVEIDRGEVRLEKDRDLRERQRGGLA